VYDYNVWAINFSRYPYEKLKPLVQNLISDELDTWAIKIGGVLGNTECSQLWYQLGEKYLGLPPSCIEEEEEIKEKLRSDCQQKDIVIEITIENISYYDVEDISNNFLKPLAELSSSSNRKFVIFLMFLLNSRNKKPSRECLAKFNQQLNTHVACKLETKKKFKESHIDTWLIEALRILGAVETNEQMVTSKSIYAKSQKGCPIYVYKAMYEYYQVAWEGSQIHRRVC
jgi:hypothetical protein